MPFTPPFCPYRDCPSHEKAPDPAKPWFLRNGTRKTMVVGPVQRFSCRLCGKGFSQRTFDIDYWTHRTMDYRHIQNLLVGGSGLRQSCRTLGVSWSLLSNRHSRLARQSLALHSRFLEEIRLKEELVFDGFESFSYSQFYPNNLNLLVGAQSQFVLGWNASILRRKGRMTEAQKSHREELEKIWKAPPGSIFKSSRELLNFGCQMSFGSLQVPVKIRSDEKTDYSRALASLRPYGEWLEVGALEHLKTSSKAPRTMANPLFAVNYLERQLRKDLAEHVRETVRFARRLEFSLERATVHLVHHNYFKRFRSRCEEPELTHAESAGVDRQTVANLRDTMFQDRAMGWRYPMEGWAKDVWTRTTGIPVHPVTPLPAHLLTV